MIQSGKECLVLEKFNQVNKENYSRLEHIRMFLVLKDKVQQHRSVLQRAYT